MDESPIKKLLVPAALFIGFIIVGLTGDNVIQQFGWAAIEQAQQFLSYACQIGLWISAAFFLNRLVCVLFWDGFVSTAIKGRVPRLLKDITFFVIYSIAGTGIMAMVFNKPVTGFWATSGVIGVVLGFALKNIILDVFTGLAINVDQPYTIGDWIMIVDNPGQDGNLIGCVQEINWRTTRLKTTDNNMLVVPNNVMGQKVITNFMSPGEQSRFELDFTLDFSVPTDRAIRILNASVKAVADEREGPLSDPAPKTRVTGINELGVQYRVRYWIIPRLVSPAKARNTVIQSVLSNLRQAGVTLAYPKQDTYYAPMPKREYDPKDLHDQKELLKRVPWMSALSDSEIEELSQMMQIKNVPKDTILTQKGRLEHSMYVVVEGFAETTIKPKPGSKDVVVEKFVPGDFMDCLSPILGEERKKTTKAITDMVIYEISRIDIALLVEKRPELADDIAELVKEKENKSHKYLTDYENEVIKEEEQKETISVRIKRFLSTVFSDSQK